TALAQTVQNPTLRRAQQAYDNLEYRQVLTLAQAALRERLTGPERARAYELLGFTYGAMDSILKAVDAFKQVVLIDPERQLDPNRVSPKAYSAFDVALRQVLLVRQLRVDSTSFVGGRGAVPSRFTVTQPARAVPRASGGPLGLAFVYTGGAVVGTLGLESSSLGSSSKRELAVVGGAALVTGFVTTLRKPAPRPAAANILYNRLLRDQIARRNQDIAKENVARRQQVQLTLVPLPKPGGAGPR